MGREGATMEKVKLVLGMLALESLLAGFHVVSRAALDMGVNKMAFLIYKDIAALAVVAPFAYFLEQTDRPPLTLHLTAQFFILAAFGLEQVDLKNGYGLTKVVGTVFTIAGATIITLYRGTPLTIDLEGSHKLEGTEVILKAESTWIVGCLLIFANCLALSGYLVLQVPVLKKYPARLPLFSSVLALGLIQLIAVAPFFEDFEMWKVHSRGELLTILYVVILYALVNHV